jgi:hypothetical protein
MLNPFFLQGSKNEQGLVQDLINEQIKMYGVEVYYLPRRYMTEKTIMREVTQSNFENAFPIEAYIENFEGYSDNTTILSKFGIQATNEIVLTISRERFETYIAPLISLIEDNKIENRNCENLQRPKEGDLVFLPLGKRLFEVKFVEHEKPFYQLQGNYVYTLKCELFQYEDEIIDTSIEDIDEVLGEVCASDGEDIFVGRTQTLTLVGVGSTAIASSNIVNGGIRSITVLNRGSGYNSIPRVDISAAPNGGINGIATAIMIGGIVVCTDNVNPKSQSVQSVNIVNAGSGYTVAPGVKFVGGGGSGTVAISSISNGVIGRVYITSPGSGYATPPTVSFINEIFASGVSTSSASAIATVSAAGTITAINLINAGAGYSVAPTVIISSPSSESGGVFVFNELVTGSISQTTAKVRSWDSVSNEIVVSNITGTFVPGEILIGYTSDARYKIRLVDTSSSKDGYSSNDDIQMEANEILDFTESNPFGIP